MNIKKLFSIVFAVALLISVVGSTAFAIQRPDDRNINLLLKSPVGATVGNPVVEVRLVRYGMMDADSIALVSGDAVVWDSISDDGVTVSACTVSGDSRIAGVLITTLSTADSTDTTRAGANWGYVAVSGRVLARVSGTISENDMLCGCGIEYGRATLVSDDATGGNAIIGTTGALGKTAEKWGILGVALADNAGGTGEIPIIVKCE